MKSLGTHEILFLILNAIVLFLIIMLVYNNIMQIL